MDLELVDYPVNIRKRLLPKYPVILFKKYRHSFVERNLVNQPNEQAVLARIVVFQGDCHMYGNDSICMDNDVEGKQGY